MKNFSSIVPLNLKKVSDERGLLTVLEVCQQIKFETKRIYFLSETKNNVVRGAHAHKELSQIFVCVNGSFDLNINDGITQVKETLTVNSPAYFVTNGVWRELKNFTPNTVCLVLADSEYKADDYIHSFQDFLNWKKIGK